MRRSYAIEPRVVLVWMIAITAMIEVLFEALISWHDGAHFELVVWVIAAVLLFSAAGTIERLKLLAEAS